MSDPLQELKIYSDGRRLSVQVDGSRMEPVSGQLLLDFDKVEISRLLNFPSQRAEETLAAALESKRRESRVWFERGIEMEQTGASVDRVIAAYLKALEYDPEAAEVHVNIGTAPLHAKEMDRSGEALSRRTRTASGLCHGMV